MKLCQFFKTGCYMSLNHFKFTCFWFHCTRIHPSIFFSDVYRLFLDKIIHQTPHTGPVHHILYDTWPGYWQSRVSWDFPGFHVFPLTEEGHQNRQTAHKIADSLMSEYYLKPTAWSRCCEAASVIVSRRLELSEIPDCHKCFERRRWMTSALCVCIVDNTNKAGMNWTYCEIWLG